MLEFSSTLGTKLVCGWIGGSARRTRDGARGRFGFAFACRNLTTYQCVKISCRLDVFDFLKDNSRFGAHLAANLPVILFGELAAFKFKIEVLNISESDFLLSLKQIPFGFFDNRGF